MYKLRIFLVSGAMLATTITTSIWAENARPTSAASHGDAQSAPPAIKNVPDGSLTTQEYAKLGLPSISRTWTSTELAKALKVLSTLADADPTRLPRFRSKRSGDVFARLTQSDVFTKTSDSSLPVKERAAESIALMKSVSPMLKLYFDAYGKGAVGAAEVTELMGLMLRASTATATPLAEIAATIDKRDASYKERMAGLKQAKKGLKEVAEGALLTLRDREHVKTPDLKRLMGYIDETFPTLVANMDADGRKATLNRLDMLVRSPAMQDFASSLSALRSKVKANLAEVDRSGK